MCKKHKPRRSSHPDLVVSEKTIAEERTCSAKDARDVPAVTRGGGRPQGGVEKRRFDPPFRFSLGQVRRRRKNGVERGAKGEPEKK